MNTQQIVDVLNEAFEADPNAIDAMLQLCVPVNDELRDHPTIQIMTKNDNSDFPVLRLIGLLNGIAALDGDKIAVEYDTDTFCVLGFVVLKDYLEQKD